MSRRNISVISAPFIMTFTMTVWRTHAHLRRGAGSGEDWAPGQRAEHKSLSAFQQELQEKGISLFISKIKKILITGGCWTTARSSESHCRQAEDQQGKCVGESSVFDSRL